MAKVTNEISDRMLLVMDYGVGNIGSLVNMLKKIGTPSTVSHEKEDILKCTKIILPGIGAFDSGMQRLNELDIIAELNKKVLDEKIPVLGICLGMQLMATKSSEGKLNGLSWFDGSVTRFDFAALENSALKIPHMGWNFIEQKKSSKLFQDFPDDPKFYFVHSFHFKADHPEDVLCTTNYGYDFVSAIEKDNIAGVQFHPEKSHKFGMQLLKNFVDLY